MTERRPGRRRKLRQACATVFAAACLAACGGDATSPDTLRAHAEAAREPAEASAGKLLLRASIAPLDALPAVIASRYGVDDKRDGVLLVASVVDTDAGDERPQAARVLASVRDLRGVRRDVAMREVAGEGYLEYVGVVRASAPDTLRFDVQARSADGTELALQFSRDILPPPR